MKWFNLQFVLWGTMAFLAGCEPSPPSLDNLRQRVEAYWEARTANDLFTQFDYEIAKPLGLVSLQDYVKSGGKLLFNRAKITEIKPKSPTNAEVTLEVEYILPALGGKGMKQSLTTVWTVHEGQWYHDPRRNNGKAPTTP